MATDPPKVSKLAQLRDPGGKPQSITSRPELGLIEGFPVVFVGTGRYLGTDDLVDPATLAPPNQWAYQQSFYAIKDKGDGSTYANFRAANVVENKIVIQSPVSRTTTNKVDFDWADKDGWFVDFNPSNDSPGERVNLDPQLVQGTIIVVTNVPNNSACTVGGDSWIYQFDYKSGNLRAVGRAQAGRAEVHGPDHGGPGGGAAAQRRLQGHRHGRDGVEDALRRQHRRRRRVGAAHLLARADPAMRNRAALLLAAAVAAGVPLAAAAQGKGLPELRAAACAFAPPWTPAPSPR